MALDTQEKRQNAAGVGRAWLRGSRFPVGAINQQARIASGLGYGGNVIAAGVIAAITLENIAGTAPSLSSVAGSSPRLDDIEGKG